MTDIVFNTGETQSELRAKYNPEGSILRRAQMRMLDMLLYFDKVCKEQKISYRIDGGNVLGAVRHGGFIPWDDDVDVVIMRKDLRRLCDYLIKNPHPQYKLQTFKTDYGYVGAWVVLRDTKSEYIQNSIVHKARKYRGLQIDIFPYENRVIKPLHHFSGKITKKNGKWFVGNHMKVARMVYILQHRMIFIGIHTAQGFTDHIHQNPSSLTRIFVLKGIYYLDLQTQICSAKNSMVTDIWIYRMFQTGITTRQHIGSGIKLTLKLC